MPVVQPMNASAFRPWLAHQILSRDTGKIEWKAGPGSPRPANPDHEPIPGGNIPTEVPPQSPDEMPDTGPTGPRTPYPVNDPGISEPTGPGSEPDYLPGRPSSPMQV